MSHKDEFFGEVAIFKQQLNLQVPLQQAAANASLSVTYQAAPRPASAIRRKPDHPAGRGRAGTAAPLPAVNTAPTEQPATPASLPFSPLWALLIGIGIAFTPCVLPMYPISGIILGRDRPQSSGRILALAVVYVQGMALTYTCWGWWWPPPVCSSSGAAAPLRADRPVGAVYRAGAVDVRPLFLQLPSALQTRLAS